MDHLSFNSLVLYFLLQTEAFHSSGAVRGDSARSDTSGDADQRCRAGGTFWRLRPGVGCRAWPRVQDISPLRCAAAADVQRDLAVRKCGVKHGAGARGVILAAELRVGGLLSRRQLVRAARWREPLVLGDEHTWRLLLAVMAAITPEVLNLHVRYPVHNPLATLHYRGTNV